MKKMMLLALTALMVPANAMRSGEHAKPSLLSYSKKVEERLTLYGGERSPEFEATMRAIQEKNARSAQKNETIKNLEHEIDELTFSHKEEIKDIKKGHEEVLEEKELIIKKLTKEIADINYKNEEKALETTRKHDLTIRQKDDLISDLTERNQKLEEKVVKLEKLLEKEEYHNENLATENKKLRSEMIIIQEDLNKSRLPMIHNRFPEANIVETAVLEELERNQNQKEKEKEHFHSFPYSESVE